MGSRMDFVLADMKTALTSSELLDPFSVFWGTLSMSSNVLKGLFLFLSFFFCEEQASVQCSFMSDSLRLHGQQHARLPCPSPTPRVCSNSCPLSRWCHPTISSSVIPFSCCLQSFPALGSFPMSQFFASGGQSIGVSASASVLPMTIQDWFPLGLTGFISLQSKGLSRVFSDTSIVHLKYSVNHVVNRCAVI